MHSREFDTGMPYRHVPVLYRENGADTDWDPGEVVDQNCIESGVVTVQDDDMAVAHAAIVGEGM